MIQYFSKHQDYKNCTLQVGLILTKKNLSTNILYSDKKQNIPTNLGFNKKNHISFSTFWTSCRTFPRFSPCMTSQRFARRSSATSTIVAGSVHPRSTFRTIWIHASRLSWKRGGFGHAPMISAAWQPGDCRQVALFGACWCSTLIGCEELGEDRIRAEILLSHWSAHLVYWNFVNI